MTALPGVPDGHFEGRIGHWFVVELNTDEVGLGFSGLEVHPELGVPFGLDIVGNILVVDRDDDLQIAGSGVGRVYGEVDWFVNDAGGEVGHVDLGGVVSLDDKGRPVDVEVRNLDLNLVVDRSGY